MKITLKTYIANIEVTLEGDIEDAKDRKGLVNQMFYTRDNIAERALKHGLQPHEAPKSLKPRSTSKKPVSVAKKAALEEEEAAIEELFEVEDSEPDVEVPVEEDFEDYSKVTDSQKKYLKALGATDKQINALKNKKEATALINKLKGE